jgi:hypothetical protein
MKVVNCSWKGKKCLLAVEEESVWRWSAEAAKIQINRKNKSQQKYFKLK